MPQFDFELEGLDALQKQLKQLDPKFQKRAYRNTVRAAMKPVAVTAAATAPVGTEMHKTYKGRWVSPGFLSRSIRQKVTARRDGSAFVSLVGVAPEAFYGVQFLELGTSTIPRRPWLEPSYRANRRQVLSVFQKRLKKQIALQLKKQQAAR